MPELEQLDLAAEDGGELLEPVLDVEGRQQVLLLLERDVQVGGNEVRGLARILDVHHHHLQLVRQVGDHRDELGELVHHVNLHCLDVLRGLVGVLQVAHLRLEVRFPLRVAGHLDALEPLDQDADAPVGVLEHLQDASRGAPRVEPFGVGVLVLRVLLREEAEHPVAGQRLLHEPQRGAPRDQQRDDGRRENDDPAQRQDRQLGRDGDAADVLVEAVEALRRLLARGVVRHRPTPPRETRNLLAVGRREPPTAAASPRLASSCTRRARQLVSNARVQDAQGSRRATLPSTASE